MTNCPLLISNLIVYCFLGWKIELCHFRQVYTDLAMELKELSKPPIHVPLISAQFHIHLVGVVSVWSTPLLDHGWDPNLNQPVYMERIKQSKVYFYVT